jgi:23S rRNA (pseudouridine1915-N3)-methyltransferase
LKIFLYFVGKPKDANANRLAEDFVTRVSHYARCEMREVRPDRFDPWQKHPPAQKIALDQDGRAMDSAGFTRLLERGEREGRDLVFAVGGHDGLPPAWRQGADLLLSLSPMTFPHELARAMLAEQLYRAFTTLRGHPYPR